MNNASRTKHSKSSKITIKQSDSESIGLQIKEIPTTQSPKDTQAQISITQYGLYKKLADLGFPQGGGGNWIFDENGINKVYKPHPSEIYLHFLSNPEGWDKMGEAMVKVWIEWHGK